jgi:surface antigen
MRVASLRKASIVALATLPFLVTACGSDHRQGSAATVGALTGSVAAANAGGRNARASAEAVIGGIGGREIGRTMQEGERRIAANAEYRALEYGQSGAAMAWNDPATRHRGSIVPGRPYQQGRQYCRTYTHTIYAGRSPQMTKGTACRETNGTWHTVS